MTQTMLEISHVCCTGGGEGGLHPPRTSNTQKFPAVGVTYLGQNRPINVTEIEIPWLILYSGISEQSLAHDITSPAISNQSFSAILEATLRLAVEDLSRRLS